VTTCGAPVRGSDEPCHLSAGHRPHHSAVTFDCDGCGRTVRGVPYRIGAVSHTSDEEFGFCFPCVKDSEKPRPADDEPW
jgi:hypothetical protein